MHLHQGELMGRIAVIKVEGSLRSIAILSLRMHNSKDELPYTVADGTSVLPDRNDEFYRALVQIKVASGSLKFTTEAEKRALKEWTDTLQPVQKEGLKKFIASIRKVDNVKMLNEEWSNSELAQLLA